MKKETVKYIIASILFVIFSAFIFFSRDKIVFSPWVTTGEINYPTYAYGNDERNVVIVNSEQSVVVLSTENEFIYQLNSNLGSDKSFSSVAFVAMDELNNVYVMDVLFRGAFLENRERVLKYSETGKFLGAIYTYNYANDDFISTKGKICGMTYFNGAIYLARLENDGFWIERVATEHPGDPEVVVFIEYTNALQDLAYINMNVNNKRISATTKAGGIKQYDFFGTLTYVQYPIANSKSLLWTAVTDDDDNIIYADIITGEIIFINTKTDEQNIIYASAEDESLYYRLNYTNKTLYASSYFETNVGYASDSTYMQSGACEFKPINSFSYSSSSVIIKTILFAACIIYMVAFLIFVILLVKYFSKQKIDGSLKAILFAGFCIAFGVIIASFLIFNEMSDRYNERTYNLLENVSRLMAASIDTSILTSISSPSQYDSEEYTLLKTRLRTLFSRSQFSSERIYQMIWMVNDDTVYSMYDLENALGTYFPFDVYTDDSYYKKVFDTGEYVHFANITSSGKWLFACGPIFDDNNNIIALIETGYDMGTVQEQMQKMIFQTMLIVISVAIAVFLIILEFILILEAYNKSKTELAKNESLLSQPKSELRKAMMSFMIMMTEAVKISKIKQKKDLVIPFHPELLRAIVFFLFVSCNLATALLPMYASNLYQPVFNLPREFIVTLPFMTDMIFAAIALLVIPILLGRIGIKKVAILAGTLIAIGNLLCFLADNTMYLAVAYAFTGFAGGALLLVINAIIGAQKQIDDVNSGFAHFNASYLAGVNVGVVFGSILAQFFSYRIVYLFSTLTGAILLGILIFSVRSKLVNHIYNIEYFKERRKYTLIKFVFNPVVLCTLFLVLMPYAVSMSFINYFMPIFGTDNGLRESNIGQLILLNGLFAILFGTVLCEYFSKKFPLKFIMIVSLLLNIGAIYLFTLNVSVIMLIIVVFLLAIANIFTLTNIQTYYATLYQNSRVSSMKALSVYSAVENMSMAIGPLVFSYILAYNIVAGMRLLAAVLLICLILFIIISVLSKDKKGEK